MIDVKTISKPKKQGGSGGGSSSKTTYVQGIISEAEHATRADKAKRADAADQADYASRAGTAQSAIYAQMAGELDEDAQILQKYLRKDIDDEAQGTYIFHQLQRLLKGLQAGEFEQGLYGHGAQIDEHGDMEANSIFARQFISAPKFIFNEISVTKAEVWITNGRGTIESVDKAKKQIKVKLEDGEYGSVAVGDICRGIYADLDNTYGSDDNNEGEMDECNFQMHKGFFTTYFYVKRIITQEKGKCTFEYGKKSEATPDPCAFMDFAQYGNFTDTQRQSTIYICARGTSYIENLEGVSTWEVQSENRVSRLGDLNGLRKKNKNGKWEDLKGQGLFVNDNIYFGGAYMKLEDISDLDDLKLQVEAYEVTLSQYSSVITVDDLGNVIDGLWTAETDGSNKQYRISTAVFVNKGESLLLLEDDASEYCTEGHYRVYAVGGGCSVDVKNGTVYVTGIDGIKDGVGGSSDDADFDYDNMRKMTMAKVTIIVELEGKLTKTLDFPIRIHHDSLPFMVCDLSNENASLCWNTKTSKYVGLPVKTDVNLYYQNEPWQISSLAVSGVPEGFDYLVEDNGKGKRVTVFNQSLTSDLLPQVSNIYITAVGIYAGVRYEYTKVLTIGRSADTVVYELQPSVDSVIADKDGNTTVGNVSCRVFATSSDDKRYEVASLPSGLVLKYGKDADPGTAVGLNTGVAVSASNKYIAFALYDAQGNVLDKESVPIVAYGKDGKGVEYIYRRTTTNSSPSNPTPSNYASDSEYQRTDKEYIPSGWTDDPTGVDAVNLYEWICKRVSTNGHWGAFTDPSVYSHYGKHAPKATLSDYIVTVPTTNGGVTLLAFSETIDCKLLVDGNACSSLSVAAVGSLPSGVSISGSTIRVSYANGTSMGKSEMAARFKISGKYQNADYSDNVDLRIVPNVMGGDGDGYEFVYLRNTGGTPSKPYRTNGSLGGGWVDDPPSATDSERYVWVSYFQGQVGLPNVPQASWSAPAVWSYKAPQGDKGDKGEAVVASITISNWSESTWNSAGTAGTVWSFGSDTESKRNGCRVGDLFTVVGTATDTLNSHMITYRSTTASGQLKGTSISHTIAYRGEKGDPGAPGSSVTGPRGTKGPIIRSHDGFVSGSYTYYSGKSNDETYCDVVIINGDIYYCSSTYTSSSPSVSDGHWEQVSSVDFTATKVLLAQNATIQMANSQQINIVNNSTLWGSFRHVTSTGTPALWLGGSSGDSAPFRVTAGGGLYASDAHMSGEVTATSGSIGAFNIKTDSNGFYSLYANYPGSSAVQPEEITIDGFGLQIKNGYGYTSGNGATTRIGYGGSKMDGVFDYGNGVISVDLDTSSGASSDCTAIRVSANAKSGYKGHAIEIEDGDVVGFRPYTEVITGDKTIISATPSGTTYICTNSSDITVDLPTNAKNGTFYRFIRLSASVTFNSSNSIRRVNSSGYTSSFKSTSAHEWVECFFYDYWYIQVSRD